MIMTTIIEGIMSGLIATTALAVIGTSASAALSPKNIGARQLQALHESQGLTNSQAVQKAAWSAEDEISFWEQEEDRGG
jgi:hypothetical protein